MLARYPSALAGMLLLMTTPAFAQAEPMSITVGTADLDLTTQSGRVRLDRRIRHAANQICDLRSAGLTARTVYQSCYDAAMTVASRDAEQVIARKDSAIRLARNTR